MHPLIQAPRNSMADLPFAGDDFFMPLDVEEPKTQVTHSLRFPEAIHDSEPGLAPKPIISMRNVCKGYGSGVTRNEVLSNINLNLREGEFLAVVGFSGSGKTTLTQLLAGLVKPDSGEILMDGKPVTGPGPDRGLVFQNYSLLPWLTVRGNIALSVNSVFEGLVSRAKT